MTKQQWDKHVSHMRTHITWPANKAQILEACNGEDVEPEVLTDLKANLPDRSYKNEMEVMNIMVN